jgi:hypothetical protein
VEVLLVETNCLISLPLPLSNRPFSSSCLAGTLNLLPHDVFAHILEYLNVIHDIVHLDTVCRYFAMPAPIWGGLSIVNFLARKNCRQLGIFERAHGCMTWKQALLQSLRTPPKRTQPLDCTITV